MGSFLVSTSTHLKNTIGLLTLLPVSLTISSGVWRTVLLALNFVFGNFWLKEVYALRADLTRGNIYSISDATKRMIGQLQEPLLIRGYFSARTHPLLAPLVPQMRDLIREYEVAGRGKVRAEFIDPRENPDLEEQANRKYSIKPVPFQMADKYPSFYRQFLLQRSSTVR